jgi:isoleucyl-tRNA synthetase
LAEELYHKLIGGESVHLLDWPAAGAINEKVLHDMHFVREAINQGLAQRAAAGVKARQPLQWVNVFDNAGRLNDEFKSIIAEELNVKAVHTREKTQLTGQESFMEVWQARVAEWPLAILNTELTEELKREGLMREIVRNVQQARKQADLQVDDRIDLQLTTTSNVLSAVLTDDNLYNVVKQETLALHLNEGETEGFSAEVKVEGELLTITLSKVPE